MNNQRVRMTIEFDIDNEALQEHGLTVQDVFKHISFYEDDVIDGFKVSTNIPGLDCTSNFFLRNGKAVGLDLVPEWCKGDGLDQWRRMVVNEIDVNRAVYDLSDEEKNLLISDSNIVDFLAERMEYYMVRGDRNEYDALEMAFQNHFEDMMKDFREERLSDAILFSHVSIDENSISYGDEAPDEVLIFHDANDNVYCQFSDENFARPLRDKIQDIQEGDAFLWMNEGHICIAGEDAHQNFDEPDACWVVHDRNGEGYFEEDIGDYLGEKVRAVLTHLQARDVSLPKRSLSGLIQSASTRAAEAHSPDKAPFKASDPEH